MVLRKFGNKQIIHCTVQTDQDKGLGRSKELIKMVNDEDYTIIELIGTDSLKQNSVAERPHHDLAQMM